LLITKNENLFHKLDDGNSNLIKHKKFSCYRIMRETKVILGVNYYLFLSHDGKIPTSDYH